MIHVWIPEAFIALHRELEHHPLLLQRIQKHDGKDVEVILAEIAAYCGVALDDWYNEKDLAGVADICYGRLKQQRPKQEIYIPPDDWSRYLEDQARKDWNKENGTTRIIQ